MTARSSSTAGTDWTHGSALCVGFEALYQAFERARDAAHQVMRHPVSGASGTQASGYLQQVIPQLARGLAGVLGFSNLWQSADGRLRGLAASLPEENSRRDLRQGLWLLAQRARVREDEAVSLEQALAEQLERLRGLRSEDGTADEGLKGTLDSLAQAVAEEVAAAGDVRRTWESLVVDLEAAREYLASREPSFGPWLARQLVATGVGWRRAHSMARQLQSAGLGSPVSILPHDQRPIRPRSTRMSTQTLLSPPQTLASSIPSSVSSITLVDTAVKQLNGLPIPATPQVPLLSVHAQTAKAHARVWPSQVRPQVIGALRTIVAWSQGFDAQFNKLVEFATLIAQGRTAVIPQFKAALAPLQQQTQQHLQAAKAVKPSLAVFIEAVNGDARQFSMDGQQLQAATAALSAQLNGLQKELDQIDEEIERKQAILEGLSPLNPYAAVVMRIIDVLTGQHDSIESQADSIENQVDQTEEQIQLAQQTLQLLGGYGQDIGNVSTGINSLDEGWNTLDANFTELQKSQDIQTFNAFTPAVLSAVQSDWKLLSQQVQGLLK